MENIFKKFSNLRRWIRVYICFIIPAVCAVIPIFFLKFLITYIIIGADVLFLLPLFIYSEEVKRDKEREENQKLIDQKITYYLMTINKKMPEANIAPTTKTDDASNNKQSATKSVSSKFDNLIIGGISKEQIENFKPGDTLTIQHKPTIEYPNSIYIINDRTTAVLGTLELSLAMSLIEAWELMLKAHLMNCYGIDSIYYKDNPNRTITLSNYNT